VQFSETYLVGVYVAILLSNLIQKDVDLLDWTEGGVVVYVADINVAFTLDSGN
jgi:hypothetical protein